jgi:hypothetical protein
MSAQEAIFANASSPHHTVIVDVSTLEGQQFLNTLNGDLYEFWDDPTVDQSLIQVIDARQ